jgi:hypothetical protein
MKRVYQLSFALVIGAFSLYAAFTPIKEMTLFFSWIYDAPFVCLCIIAAFFLFLNFREYLKNERLASFVPFSICFIIIIVTIWQNKRRELIDNGDTYFTATTYEIGDDGGLVLDFKKDGHLKAERRDHWAITYYWGKYVYRNDTMELNIPVDFKMGRKAILRDSSMQIIGDTVLFRVVRE